MLVAIINVVGADFVDIVAIAMLLHLGSSILLLFMVICKNVVV